MRCCLLVLLAGCSLTLQKVPAERTGPELVDCSEGYARPIVDVAAGVAAGIATAYGFQTELRKDCEALGCVILPSGVVLAIVLPLVGVHGFETVHACRTTKVEVARVRRDEEAKAQRTAAREHAWQLTQQAAAAARAGDCTAVRDASARVRDEDGEFHAVVFSRDVAIARCLATP